MKFITKVAIGALLAVYIAGAAPASAQQPGEEPAFMMALFPPDLIMHHQRQLGLTEKQRSEILTVVKAFQSEASDLQWEIQNEQQALGEMVSAPRVRESEALAQAKKVMEIETRFKLAHLKLLLTLKNQLNEEQLTALSEIRSGQNNR